MESIGHSPATDATPHIPARVVGVLPADSAFTLVCANLWSGKKKFLGAWPPIHFDLPLLQPAPPASIAGSFVPGPVAAEIRSLAQLPEHDDYEVEVYTCDINRKFYKLGRGALNRLLQSD